MKEKKKGAATKKRRRLTEKQRERLRENHADNLIGKITSGDLSGVMEKVGWILNHFSSARNSDITCLIQYWKKFEPDIIKGDVIYVQDLYKHTQLTRYPRFAPLILKGLRVRAAAARRSPTLRSPANPRLMPRVCSYGLAQRRR